MLNLSLSMCRDKDIEECLSRIICGTWLRGLICVVPKHGVGDKAGWYCIGNFVVDWYSVLLEACQCKFGRLCWRSVFLRHQMSVCHI